MVMVCIQVLGNDNAVAFAGSQGNFELNAMRPIIVTNVLHSARILSRRVREAASVQHREHDAQHAADQRVCESVPDAGDGAQPGQRLRQGLGHRAQSAGRGARCQRDVPQPIQRRWSGALVGGAARSGIHRPAVTLSPSTARVGEFSTGDCGRLRQAPQVPLDTVKRRIHRSHRQRRACAVYSREKPSMSRASDNG